MLDAMTEVEVTRRMRAFNVSRIGQPVSSFITRSPQNEEIAASMGITADELADRLARPDHNEGTRKRIPEADFDKAMKRMNLTGDEGRLRFSGKFWTE